MKRIILLSSVLAMFSLPSFASSTSGAEKLINKLSKDEFFMNFSGEGCSMSLRYNAATSISSGGPILVVAKVRNDEIEIMSKMDVEKSISSPNTITLKFHRGVIAEKSKIIITVDSEGKPLRAKAYGREYFGIGKVDCRFN